MHSQRVWVLIGVVTGIIGLFMKAATSGGESLMAQIAQSVPDFPEGLPTIWGGLDTWAQIAVVVAIAVLVVIAFRPVLREPLDRMSGIVLIVIGLGLFAYAVVKWMEARDSASDLEDAFTSLASAGAVPEAYGASANTLGFLVLMLGTAIVAGVGAVALSRGRQQTA